MSGDEWERLSAWWRRKVCVCWQRVLVGRQGYRRRTPVVSMRFYVRCRLRAISDLGLSHPARLEEFVLPVGALALELLERLRGCLGLDDAKASDELVGVDGMICR